MPMNWGFQRRGSAVLYRPVGHISLSICAARYVRCAEGTAQVPIELEGASQVLAVELPRVESWGGDQ